MSQVNSPKIPLHLVTGFLGVGKTTAIIRLLQLRKDREKIAVIVNEFGETGIDGTLITADGKPFDLVEIPGGCICCADNEMLLDSLNFLLTEVKPDRIIIEPSGIARPSDLIFRLKGSDLIRRIELRPLITLIDPILYLDEDFRDSVVFDDQIESADIAVISRIDLAGPEKTEKVRLDLDQQVPPKLAIYECGFGAIPESVLDLQLPPRFSFRVSQKNNGHLPALEYTGKGRIWADGEFHEKMLTALFRDLEGDNRVLRAKGVFIIGGAPWLFEIAGGCFFSRTSEFRFENRFDIIVRAGESSFAEEIFSRAENCRTGPEAK